jgi:hypothetical protein
MDVAQIFFMLAFTYSFLLASPMINFLAPTLYVGAPWTWFERCFIG